MTCGKVCHLQYMIQTQITKGDSHPNKAKWYIDQCGKASVGLSNVKMQVGDHTCQMLPCVECSLHTENLHQVPGLLSDTIAFHR